MATYSVALHVKYLTPSSGIEVSIHKQDQIRYSNTLIRGNQTLNNLLMPLNAQFVLHSILSGFSGSIAPIYTKYQ